MNEAHRNNIVVVIPTYNERDNIARLIGAIDRLNLSADILIVDDNSPDRTGEMVESIKKSRPDVDIIHRKRREGLGPAYIEAFRYILSKGAYDYIVQMDADFSHNPNDIPKLIAAVRGCDVAVGSRYIRGGGVSERWSIFRKLLSRSGNIYAKFITGLDVNDCTAGFKCYKKKALESIDLNSIFLNGYGFQVQVLYELKRKNNAICEIPIFFEERTAGDSKMDTDIVLEAFFSLIGMRLKSLFVAR